jgi:hypothetical protein
MLAGLAAAVSIGVIASAHAAVLVEVDKSTQRMTVSVDGQTVYHFPVSTGRGVGGNYDTPNGTWKAFRMEKDHFSKEWDDAPMPNSIFFTKIGHAIHGSFDLKNMGNPASHGCVRLQPENAEKLFELVKKEGVLKTTVVISGDIMVAERRAAEQRALARANGTTTTARRGQTAGAPVQLDPQAYDQQQQYQYQQQQRRYGAGYDRGYVSGSADAYRGSVYADGADQRGYVRRYDSNGYVQPQQQTYGNNGYEAPPPRRGFFIFGN